MPLGLSWETRARVDPCRILLLERAWATLSLAMPMKPWDSAGRECGGTLLFLHAYIHTDHFLYRSIFILSGFFLIFFCTSDALHFASRQDGFTHCEAMMIPLFERKRKNFCKTKIRSEVRLANFKNQSIQMPATKHKPVSLRNMFTISEMYARQVNRYEVF